MPLPFNKTLDLKLIEMVKDNPIIYNVSHPKHMDFDEREVVWQKIGDALSRPGSLCKARFANMRDQMRRKHKERLKSQNHMTQIRSYKYEEELAFTIPFFRDIEPQNADDYADYLEEEANKCEVEMPREVFINENGEFEHDTKDLNLEFRKRNDTTANSRDVNDSIIQELNTTDPLDVFLLTIGTTLRKFTPYYLNQAKSKIFQVVQDYELEQIMNKEGRSAQSGDKR
ncbi:hypothetical protein evm_000301 [Chilo suppressalis]|nr:hypothetical protein evm_000301 [Chilo suppressalis]